MIKYVAKVSLTLFLFKKENIANFSLKQLKHTNYPTNTINKCFIKLCICAKVQTLKRRLIYVKYVFYYFLLFAVIFFIENESKSSKNDVFFSIILTLMLICTSMYKFMDKLCIYIYSISLKTIQIALYFINLHIVSRFKIKFNIRKHCRKNVL